MTSECCQFTFRCRLGAASGKVHDHTDPRFYDLGLLVDFQSDEHFVDSLFEVSETGNTIVMGNIRDQIRNQGAFGQVKTT